MESGSQEFPDNRAGNLRLSTFSVEPLFTVFTVWKISFRIFHKFLPKFSLSTPQFSHTSTSGKPDSEFPTFSLFLQIITVKKKFPTPRCISHLSTFQQPLLLLLFFLLTFFYFHAARPPLSHSPAVETRTDSAERDICCRQWLTAIPYIR